MEDLAVGSWPQLSEPVMIRKVDAKHFRGRAPCSQKADVIGRSLDVLRCPQRLDSCVSHG